LTASAMDTNRQSAFRSGADDFLAKPCHEEELLRKIGTLLNIVYDYEDSSEGRDDKRSVVALSAERLGHLPLQLVEELGMATRTGKKKLLDKLIVNVRETGDSDSAIALQELADNYEYDALTRVLEEACRR
jgi:DNA-binding response OmpR family regulator